MKTYIYTLTDPDTNQVRYVGKTVNVKRRYYGHTNENSNKRLKNSHLANWLLLLLKNNKKPILEVIDECDSNWEELEKYWIAQFKAWGFKLTNLTEGGQGGTGYKQTEEHKRNISEAKKASKRKLSEEQRQFISERMKNNQYSKGAVRTKEIKENLKLLKSKPVLQYDKLGNFIKEFNSIKQASIETNTFSSSISNNLNNKSKTAGGFIWKYKN